MGASRNIGLYESDAPLIWFLDVDDYPLPSFLEKMVNVQRLYDADIVACNFMYASDPSNVKLPRKRPYAVKVMDRETALYERSIERFPVPCWCKLYKRGLLVNNSIVFSDGYCEDIYHTYSCINHSDVVCYYEEPLYVYYQHYNSFCNNNSISDRRGLAEIDAYGCVIEALGDTVPNKNFRKHLAHTAIRSSGHMSYGSFIKYAKSEECAKQLGENGSLHTPEALWYRTFPSSYYFAIRAFFKLFYYRTGRIYTPLGKTIGREYIRYEPLANRENKIHITVGICAYNEEKNIERTIRSVFRQTSSQYELDRVIVVSSGSTDGTDKIVTDLSEEFSCVKLISQPRREGKNSAINLFLNEKNTDVVVFLNADNVFESVESLDRLIEPFYDSKIGMVGGRPVPTNDLDNMTGYTVQLLWNMHHNVSLQKPKAGELIAFRDIGTRLPTDVQSDEDILKMKLEENGYSTVYAPLATVLNRGPESLNDYVKQRIRVNIGEYYLKKKHGYELPTHDLRIQINAFLTSAGKHGFHPIRTVSAVILETWSRFLAMVHVKTNRGDISVWEQISTTKKL